MSRLKKHAAVPSLFGAEPLSASLKKQPRYSNKPWQPGEIPRKEGFAQIPVIQALDDTPQPYGEFFAVQKPENRGKGYSPVQIVDVEGHETKRKQTSGEHGGSAKV